MIYWVEQALWCLVLAAIFIAVMWETQHLLDWIVNLHQNDAAGVLREHACDYTEWFFGTDFGWKR